MARRRGQKTGHIRRKGPSWLLQWREYAKDESGRQKPIIRSQAIAPALGPDRVSKREAERIAREDHLPKIDQRNIRPGSMMLVSDFIDLKFDLMVARKKKPAGQKHYTYVLGHIKKEIGARRLCDIGLEDVEILVAKLHKAGYSNQTVLHVKNGVSAVFRLAKKLKLYADENPAADVELPEVVAKTLPTYGAEQLRRLLPRLSTGTRLMAFTSIETSMNAAELCGLKQKWANLTDQIVITDGEVLAPFSIAVRENHYEGKRGTLKTGSRRRNVPITPDLAGELRLLIQQSKIQSPDAPVFQSRSGTPIDTHNVSNREFRRIAKEFGFPVTWHAFRRAHSTFAGMIGVSVEDRVATMGHADSKMTLHYSVEDMERRRAVPQRIMGLLFGETKGGVQ